MAGSVSEQIIKSKIILKFSVKDATMQFEKNIIFRRKTTTLFDEAPSLGHIIIDQLTRAGDKTVIVCGVTGQTLSGKELLDRSIQISKALLGAGIKQGDVVSVISESRFDYIYVIFGTIFINCVLAPLNHAYSQRELINALNFSKPKFIFTGGSSADDIIQIGKTLGCVKKIICFDDRAECSSGSLIVNLSDFADSKNVLNVKFEPTPVNVVKTPCLIMCSSGTTGFPKGVQLSQNGVIATASNFKTFLFNESNFGNKEPVQLGLLPLFHVFGSLVLIVTMTIMSGKMVLLPKFEEKTFLQSIETYRCTLAYLVPPLLVFLAKHPLVDRYDLSSLKVIMCGAAPISKELEQSVKNRLKIDLTIKQMYGMTELTSITLMQKDILKPGSVGDVNENVYAKVIDTENGNPLGPNQIGELCFKTDLIMMGYVNDLQATSAIIDEEGWLHTGDVGYYDNDLQFFIVDRIKELIKYKGFQVPPAGMLSIILRNLSTTSYGRIEYFVSVFIWVYVYVVHVFIYTSCSLCNSNVRIYLNVPKFAYVQHSTCEDFLCTS